MICFEDVIPDENGELPKTPRPKLDCLLHESRLRFINGFDIIASHPDKQATIGNRLHLKFHLGLLRDVILLLAQEYFDRGIPVSYYPSTEPYHSTDSYIILNGDEVDRLPSFKNLCFDDINRLLVDSCPGQRWNEQFTFGFATQNCKDQFDSDIVNLPTIKEVNSLDGVMDNLVVGCNLVDEIDPDYRFHLPEAAREERRQKHASRLVKDYDTEKWPELLRMYLESMSAIRTKHIITRGGRDMYVERKRMIAGGDHKSKPRKKRRVEGQPGGNSSGSSSTTSESSAQDSVSSTESIGKKFLNSLGIPDKKIVFFVHVDRHNGWEKGNDFLASVARTRDLPRERSDPRGMVRRQRELFTFCQRKCNEDATIREDGTDEIMGVLVNHRAVLPRAQKTKDYERLIFDIRATGARIRNGADNYYLRDTHENKSFFYSLLHDAIDVLRRQHNLCVMGRIEMAVALTETNGLEKISRFSHYLSSKRQLTDDFLPFAFNDYCMKRDGGSVASGGKFARSQASFRTPVLGLQFYYSARVILEETRALNLEEKNLANARKAMTRNVRNAGDLRMNEIMTALLFSQVIWNRDAFASPTVPSTLAGGVRKEFFDKSTKMTQSRISRAVEQASDALAWPRSVGEHGMCEALRHKRGEKPGQDPHRVGQSFCFWDERKPSLLIEVPAGGKWKDRKKRTEAEDRNVVRDQCQDNRPNRIFHWELGEYNRKASLVQYVKDAEASGADPFRVIYPTSRSRSQGTKEEGMSLFLDYLSEHKIEVDVVPRKTRAQLNAYIADGGQGMKEKKRKAKEGQGKSEKTRKAQRGLTLSDPIDDCSTLSDSSISTSIPPTIAVRANSAHRRSIDLAGEAKKIWRIAYGTDLPSCEPTQLWCQDRQVRHRPQIEGHVCHVIDNLPPCALLETKLEEDEKGNLVFRTKQLAKRATFWWIVANVGQRETFVKWARRLMGGVGVVRLGVTHREVNSTFTTIVENTGGEIVIQHGGEEMKISV